jgi:hypothetical protein
MSLKILSRGRPIAAITRLGEVMAEYRKPRKGICKILNIELAVGRHVFRRVISEKKMGEF